MGVLEALIVRWAKNKAKRWILKKYIIGALKSKTFGLAWLLTAMTWLSNNTAVVDAVIPSSWQEVAGYAIALSIAVLRVVTNKPLNDK